MLKRDESGDCICEKDTSYVCPYGDKHGTCFGCPLGDAIDNRQPKENCKDLMEDEMSKTIEEIEAYKAKIIENVMFELKKEYSDARGNFSDTGYDRYQKKMDKCEKEMRGGR